jgi:GNAT superfamily N-acetyltransferase
VCRFGHGKAGGASSSQDASDEDRTAMARHELWVELADRPGNLAALAGELAACEANIVHLDVHAGTGSTVIDRLVVDVPDGRSADLAAVARRAGATLRVLDGAVHGGPPPGVLAFAGDAVDDVVGDHTDDGDDGDDGAAASVALARAAASHPANGASRRRRSPITLERLVALPDNGLVRLRHLSAGDRDALIAHHERCSPDTRRHSRFLLPGLLPPRRPVRDPVTPDATSGAGDHVALAALIGGDIVGAGRYDVDPAGVATLAVIVEDTHQGRGIGALLVNELAVLASNAEVRHLRAVAPSGGEVLSRTLQRAGLSFTTRRDGDALVFDCGLPDGLSASA